MSQRKHLERVDLVKLRLQILANYTYDADTGEIFNNKGNGRPLTLLIEGTNPFVAKAKVKVEGKSVIAARVAWLLQTKGWPEGPVICLNGLQSDIRFTNLFDQTDYAQPDEIPPDEQETPLSALRETHRRFLEDLRHHHPKGPINYNIRSSGIPKPYYSFRAGIGSSAAMCADFGGNK